jgi:hypothetical protein
MTVTTAQPTRVDRADWPAVLSFARALFPPANAAGVVGFVIVPLPDGTGLLRLVRRPRAEGALPQLQVGLRRGPATVVPEVVFDSPRPKHRAAAAFTGLRAGAAIQTGTPPAYTGGICLLLTADGAAPSHFLTAGHLFARGALRTPVLAAADGGPTLVVGWLACNLLDAPAPGAGFPLDASLIELTPEGVTLALETTPQWPTPTDVPTSAAFGWNVQALRPTTNGLSAPSMTAGTGYTAYLNADARGLYEVRDVLWTVSPITDYGDSGTLLVSADLQSAAGCCTGVFGSASLFEPLGRVVRALDPSLAVWSPR